MTVPIAILAGSLASALTALGFLIVARHRSAPPAVDPETATERTAREAIVALAKTSQALTVALNNTTERFATYRMHVENPSAAGDKAAHDARAVAVATRSGAEQAIGEQVAAEEAAAREIERRKAETERAFAEGHDFADAYPGGDGATPTG